MIRFGQDRPRRRPNLTPMIDVVFLLLVFFMLASRFGTEESLRLVTAGSTGQAAYAGPPRLVEVAQDGLRLNGQPVAPEALVAALAPLMASPEDIIVLRPVGAVGVQALIGAIDLLNGAGLTRLAVIGGP